MATATHRVESSQQESGNNQPAEATTSNAADASGHNGCECDFEQQVSSVIEQQVVPKLLNSHQAESGDEPTVRGCCAEQVAQFTDLVLNCPDEEAIPACFDQLRAEGYSIGTLYLDLLTPTARRLGDYWKEDLCSFADVTLGLCRLQHLLHLHGADFWIPLDDAKERRRIMLAPSAGEQHSFGLLMVAEFFRRGGWDVWSGPGATTSEMAGIVHDEWFEVVGLSLSAENRIDTLEADIRAIRRRSRNQEVQVLVGGQVFIDHPDWALDVGADDTAANGHQAVDQANSLVSEAGNGS